MYHSISDTIGLIIAYVISSVVWLTLIVGVAQLIRGAVRRIRIAPHRVAHRRV